jgi:hypothetical protein
MNRDERTADTERALRTVQESSMRDLMVVLPVKVVTYNGEDQPPTVKLQPTVQIKKQMPDGKVVNVTLPEIPRAPVHFAGGGGYTLTHPISEGDEGHIMIASRSIESWMDKGGVQPPAHAHYHDLTDAIFIPGLRSKPRALSNLSTNSVQLRSDDGNAVLDFTSSTMKLTFSGGGEFVFNSNGDFTATGEITRGLGTSNSVKLGTHKHSGVQTGGGQTNVPVPGT